MNLGLLIETDGFVLDLLFVDGHYWQFAGWVLDHLLVEPLDAGQETNAVRGLANKVANYLDWVLLVRLDDHLLHLI